MKYEEYGASRFLSLDGIWRDLEDVPLPGDPLPRLFSFRYALTLAQLDQIFEDFKPRSHVGYLLFLLIAVCLLLLTLKGLRT